MIIDFQSLLNPKPPYQFGLMWPLIALFALTIVGAIFLPYVPMKPWRNRLKQRLLAPLWILGLVGFLLLFARYQSIPYLAMPALLALLLLVSLLWIGYSLRVAFRESRQAKAEFDRKERLERYLPRKKQ
jgi:hypothetical protein